MLRMELLESVRILTTCYQREARAPMLLVECPGTKKTAGLDPTWSQARPFGGYPRIAVEDTRAGESGGTSTGGKASAVDLRESRLLALRLDLSVHGGREVVRRRHQSRSPCRVRAAWPPSAPVATRTRHEESRKLALIAGLDAPAGGAGADPDVDHRTVTPTVAA